MRLSTNEINHTPGFVPAFARWRHFVARHSCQSADWRTDGHTNFSVLLCLYYKRILLPVQRVNRVCDSLHEMRTIAIDDPVAWAYVSQSVTRATVLTHSMRLLLHYCSLLFWGEVKVLCSGETQYVVLGLPNSCKLGLVPSD